MRSRLRPLWAAVANVLVVNRLREVDIADVGKRRQPRQDIRELLLEVRPIEFATLAVRDRVRELADLLDEPEIGARCAPRAVGLAIPLEDQALEYAWMLALLGRTSDAAP